MNKITTIPDGAEQWLINLIEWKNKVGKSSKQIADEENLAEKSVSNVFSGKSKNPGIDLVRRIMHSLGATSRDIFSDSGAFIGGQELIDLQQAYDNLLNEYTALKATYELLNAEYSVIKDKVGILTSENDLLRLKLEHKEEIIAIHNYYNKIKG